MHPLQDARRTIASPKQARAKFDGRREPQSFFLFMARPSAAPLTRRRIPRGRRGAASEIKPPCAYALPRRGACEIAISPICTQNHQQHITRHSPAGPIILVEKKSLNSFLFFSPFREGQSVCLARYHAAKATPPPLPLAGKGGPVCHASVSRHQKNKILLSILSRDVHPYSKKEMILLERGAGETLLTMMLSLPYKTPLWCM